VTGRRSHRRAAAGVLLLLAALAAALISRGVAEAERAFRGEQASWQRGVVARPLAPAGTTQRLGAKLLGVEARTDLLRAYSAYRSALRNVIPGTVYPQTQARFDAIRTIEGLRSSLARGHDRAQADVVLGLTYEASASAAGSRRLGLLGNATRAFAAAVREDGSNAEAKYGLERLLAMERRARADRRSRTGSGSGRKDRSGRPATPRAEQPGNGY
jgi:hypothetical protein